MAQITINGSFLGTNLLSLLVCDDIVVPGTPPNYQLCKTIFVAHPLGAKMAEQPIRIAQSQAREISVPAGPEERVKEAFLAEWEKLNCTGIIFNVMRTSRIYGISSVALLSEQVPDATQPIEWEKLAQIAISFNVLDPLNTSGSLVLNQDPNAPDFQKTNNAIRVDGKSYHPSRCCVMLNEDPLYIEWTTSAFGFVGRSVYQRALFPLKSFVQSMITDDLVTKKAGLLIAMMKQAGAIVDNVMNKLFGIKRSQLQSGMTGNVLSIDRDDKIEAIDMTNTATAMTTARRNIIENIATAAPMPAKLLLQESFAEGFGEGSEDAKHIAEYINGTRRDMAPIYAYFDNIVQYRAWTQEFYDTLDADYRKEFPYKVAFYEWRKAFHAEWPSLLQEPESEKIKTDDVKLKAIIATIEVLEPVLDPENKAVLVEWAQDNLNENKRMFTSPLELDIEALRNYVPPMPMQAGLEEEKPPAPFAKQA